MTVLKDAGLRQAAAVMAVELAAALTVPPRVDYGDDYRPDSPRWRDQSLSKGSAGVAVLHGLRAQCGLGGEEVMHAWLARATRDDLSAGPGAGLWFGAPAVAFAISIAAPGRYPGAMTSLDAAVADLTETRLKTALARMNAERRPALYEFDLVRGLTGLGAYLLHRDPGGDLVRRVLSYLVRLTHPVRAGDAAGLSAPGWWTAELPVKEDDPAFAAGQADFGAAHGIAGPLSLMSIAMRDGVTVEGHCEAIETICRWLGGSRPQRARGGPSGSRSQNSAMAGRTGTGRRGPPGAMAPPGWPALSNSPPSPPATSPGSTRPRTPCSAAWTTPLSSPGSPIPLCVTAGQERWPPPGMPLPTRPPPPSPTDFRGC